MVLGDKHIAKRNKRSYTPCLNKQKNRPNFGQGWRFLNKLLPRRGEGDAVFRGCCKQFSSFKLFVQLPRIQCPIRLPFTVIAAKYGFGIDTCLRVVARSV